MRCVVALIFFIFCVICVRVTAADKQQIILEAEEIICNNEDGCESPRTTIQKIISHDIDNGSLTINSQQTYTEPFHQYGMEAALQLREIVKNVHSLEFLAENNFDDHVHMIMTVTDDLSDLAAVHKLEWLYGSSDDASAMQSKSFDKTVVICKAVMRLFKLLELHATNEKETSEYISTGISSAALVLGDLFQLRPSVDSSAVIADDYFTSYEYFAFAESTIVKSLSSMSIDMNGNLLGQEDEVRLPVLDDVLTVHASINLRFGSLLLELYLSGFTLDLDNNLHHHVPSVSELPMQQLSENQKHILRKAFTKLETSTVIHRKIKFTGDVLMNQADAYRLMGTVNSLLHEWALAAKNCKLGLSMLSASVSKSQNGDMIASADDIVTTMITITQSIFEAFLHLPDEIQSAKDAFRMHLLAQQAAAEVGYGDLSDIFRKELKNEGEEEVRQLLLLNKDATLPIVDSAQVQESLNIYQSMLEETLQYGMHYVELDINGGAANDNRDILYEGSLRSVIGSLYLDLNEPWKARDELENAVQLLEEGIQLVDSGKYEVTGDDGIPLTYSLRLDLAHVLHSLSYTYLALMQWEKSYDAFDQAMDIYQLELLEGESPMDWNSIATTTSSTRESTSMTDRLLNYLFRATEDIDVEDFQQIDNTTA
ncbi:hypothetical protein QTG54_013752 [Skeletonema marinoi]|uniref:KIF-binding protein n=1 Tax=Skeletonema marinoi TaxID=267567 RepID=A0AAD8XXT0_9STRA|nr:hypothetical protein QTG54_013752 [Skeletonema marinoi]